MPIVGDAGGAIAVNNASTVTVITSTFTNNAAENGGAVFIEQVTFLFLAGSNGLCPLYYWSNNKQGLEATPVYYGRIVGVRLCGVCVVWESYSERQHIHKQQGQPEWGSTFPVQVLR